jgi:hypothetical protein
MHEPPEKLAVPFEPLVKVLLMLVPLMRKTSVSLATQTVVPVFELHEQEFTSLVVVIVVAGPPLPSPALVSSGTTPMPLEGEHAPQLPLGA